MLSPELQSRISRILSPLLAKGEAERAKLRASVETVAENVYNMLPRGDYGRGDVREAIEHLLDARSAEAAAEKIALWTAGAHAVDAASAPLSPRRMAKNPRTSSRPGVGGLSPWGEVQTVANVRGLVGAVSVTTASHGGIWLPPDLVARMPEGHRETWHEEDCEAALVFYALGVPAPEGYPRGPKAWRDGLRAVVQGVYPEVLA